MKLIYASLSFEQDLKMLSKFNFHSVVKQHDKRMGLSWGQLGKVSDFLIKNHARLKLTIKPNINYIYIYTEILDIK